MQHLQEPGIDIQRQTMPFDAIWDRKQKCRSFGFFRFFFALPLKSYMIAHGLSGPRRGCTATIIPQGDCIINQLTYLQKVFNNHFWEKCADNSVLCIYVIMCQRLIDIIVIYHVIWQILSLFVGGVVITSHLVPDLDFKHHIRYMSDLRRP